MKTYYFGEIEFGDFIKHEDYHPIALISRVDQVREFATEDEAENYMVEHGYSGYIDANTKAVEIYFRRHA
jgi:hypothetical protein